MDIDRARVMAKGNPALQDRLAAAGAHMAHIANALSEALSSSSFPLHASDLMALESAVHSGEAAALVNEAAAQGTGTADRATATPAQKAEVAASSLDTRQEVESLDRDIFERHIFDRYLHFSSAEDEAEFRKREAEAKRYIHDQLAKGTPEGNLNAGGGMMGEMLDAHAHGAGDSPQFMPRWNALVAKTERQHAAMKAAGQSTDEFDRNLDTSVRRFLKDEQHLSDAEIDHRLAVAVHPLDVVKGLLTRDTHSRHLELKIERAESPTAAVQSLPRAREGEAAAHGPLNVTVDALGVKLKAVGLKRADATETAPAQRLNVPKPLSNSGQSLAG